MYTMTNLADIFNISSARKLNQILKDLSFQRKNKFGNWVITDVNHRKYEKYKEVIPEGGKKVTIRVFTDEGKKYIKELLIEHGYYKENKEGSTINEYIKKKPYRKYY